MFEDGKDQGLSERHQKEAIKGKQATDIDWRNRRMLEEQTRL